MTAINPSGVAPLDVWCAQYPDPTPLERAARVAAVSAAVHRFVAAGRPPRGAWLEELRAHGALSSHPDFRVIWVIYRAPPGAPSPWVVRVHECVGTGAKCLSRPRDAFYNRPSLEAARSLVPYGLTQHAAHQSHDPAIFEVWA
jgi:hypothetical protein